MRDSHRSWRIHIFGFLCDRTE